MPGSGAFDYESAIWGAEELRPGERSIARFRLDEALVHLPPRGRLLEVGCGAGRFLRALRQLRPQLELVGTDPSRSALARLAARAPEIETRPGDGQRLPAGDAEFDAVLALDVLEHVPDPDVLLGEMRRVLRPAGVFHLHVPCEGDPLSLWRWLPGQRGPNALKRRFGGHLHHFRRDEIHTRLAAHGFAPLRIRYSLHLLGNLADLAAFLHLAARARQAASPATTGDLVAGGGALVRSVDGLLWLEARCLSRIPSWALHVSARRR